MRIRKSIWLALALLASATSLYYYFFADKGTEGEWLTMASLTGIGNAIDLFKEDFSRYPFDLEELAKDKKYLYRAPPLRDGWGNTIVYRLTEDKAQPFALYSYGENGRDDAGLGDDVSYWSVQKE